MEQIQDVTTSEPATGNEPFDFERHWPKGRSMPRYGLVGLFLVLGWHLWKQGKRYKAVVATALAIGMTALLLWLLYMALEWRLRSSGLI